MQGRQRRALSQALLATVLVPGAWSAAQTQQEPLQTELLTEGEGLVLTATLNWGLPDLVQDALLKGIPVHFVAEVDVLRERWYWRDEELLRAVRYLRLSYQPLTRRWRLYTGSQPFEGQGLGVALSSTYETLAEAIQAMQRIVRWRVGERAQLPDSGEGVLRLRFRIDLSHFPRPLQIGVLGRDDWNLLVTRRMRLEFAQLHHEQG